MNFAAIADSASAVMNDAVSSTGPIIIGIVAAIAAVGVIFKLVKKV